MGSFSLVLDENIFVLDLRADLALCDVALFPFAGKSKSGCLF